MKENEIDVQLSNLKTMQEMGIVTTTKFVLPKGTQKERWKSIFIWLKNIESGLQFWYGDILAYGVQNFGEDELYQLLDTKKDKTLLNYMYTCLNVEPSRRRENLSYSHHAAVAGLNLEEQEKWLDIATKEGLSVHKLQEEIKGDKKEEQPKELVDEIKDMTREEMVSKIISQAEKLKKTEKENKELADQNVKLKEENSKLNDMLKEKKIQYCNYCNLLKAKRGVFNDYADIMKSRGWCVMDKGKCLRLFNKIKETSKKNLTAYIEKNNIDKEHVKPAYYAVLTKTMEDWFINNAEDISRKAKIIQGEQVGRTLGGLLDKISLPDSDTKPKDRDDLI